MGAARKAKDYGIDAGRRKKSLIIPALVKKANGPRSGVASISPMVLALSSNVSSQERAKEHPRYFVREIRKG
jgi:hypothetical protein